ncbi:DUF2256 domain-containing protein [Profundibacterium mesophilum]|uniref:Zinc finger protein n=1 Tax=Profundibacterium mesophilum KAUST100406-0324 TaxID=1037889 RepID=A0A921NT20_9RHOB|nr:DUF2256 domain-containing protein [Profundibacterium mesophilum]KAF0674980.1 Zinc finger protein [Profundibacterium mesophilum KAUST100406-0324]
MRRKSELEQKLCRTCGRPFSWRRKWARDWESVLYCSAACRRGKPAGSGGPHAAGSGAAALPRDGDPG